MDWLTDGDFVLSRFYNREGRDEWLPERLSSDPVVRRSRLIICPRVFSAVQLIKSWKDEGD